MHLSMHNWMRSEPLETTLARLARCGYGSIEIKGEPDQYDTSVVRDQLNKYGLKCWGAVTLTLAERNLCAKDEQQRAATVQYMKDCVTMVKELDGHEITIVPSTVGKITPDGTPDEEWGWAVDGLKEIHVHASAAGVRMAIEGLNRFETHFINRGDQALTLADAVAPDVGVCLDAFHMNIEEVDFYQAIRDVGDRLVDFHVADNNRMACGMGALDWPKIVGTLQDESSSLLRSIAHQQTSFQTRSRPTPLTFRRRNCSSSSTTAAACSRRASTTCLSRSVQRHFFR